MSESGTKPGVYGTLIAILAAGVTAIVVSLLTVTTLVINGQASAPSVSDADKAKVYYNSSDNTLYISKDGGAFEVLGGATAPLTLTGTTDEVELTVVGSSGQTVSLFQLKNDALDSLLDVSIDGLVSTRRLDLSGSTEDNAALTIVPYTGITTNIVYIAGTDGNAATYMSQSTNSWTFAEKGGSGFDKVVLDPTNKILRVTSDYQVVFNSVSNFGSGSNDTGLGRQSAGIVKFTNGSTGPGGFLASKASTIDGSADEVQFIIDGHSTQTSDFARFRTSAGTYIYRFGPSSLGLGNGDVKTELHSQGLGLQSVARIYFAPGGPYSSLGDIFNVADLVVNRGASKTLGLCEDGNVNTGATWRAIARTASQITSDQNNYNPGGRSYFQRWSSDASRNVTGLTFAATQVDGQVHLIVNVGSNNIVLQHQTTSTAANQFLCSTGADITLSANQAADVIYDGTQSRWLVFKRN